MLIINTFIKTNSFYISIYIFKQCNSNRSTTNSMLQEEDILLVPKVPDKIQQCRT